MHMAQTLERSLQRAHCQFKLVEHMPSATSLESARKAGIPASRMAKSVILDDRRGHYLMAVLPANRQLDLSKVHKGTQRWQLSGEQALVSLFKDCERGAIPALGEVYGLDMLIDPMLVRQQDIYLEAGDHESLIHMPVDEFFKLAPNAEVCDLCA
ncbi:MULTISPECIES: aminoacyl-tRNA deacylase [Pseudomonas]|uniref:aminoacyl-tRNA deacylase n=1 Tax=Pseudomonas TaxID=286 RepID=UPI001553361D|nr:YbaK/EbsC family protein [Pseudomonas tumuqii]